MCGERLNKPKGRSVVSVDEDQQETAPASDEHINLIDICRHILRIVARWEGSSYTENKVCQTAEWGLDDPADPASDDDTAQG